MSDEQRIVLPLRAAYAFGDEHGLKLDISEIRDMEIEWDSSYTSTVRRGYIVELFDRHAILDEFKAKHWPFGATPGGQTYCRRYLQIKRRYMDFLAGRSSGLELIDEAEEEQIETAAAVAFELESQLRDFIAQNLERIPVRGQRCTLYVDPTDRKGVEFPTAVGPIDILATDQTGAFVVFELKRAASPDHAIGQLARYMGWVKQTIANGHEVHGVIVAKTIGEKLRYAITVLQNVSLFEYEVEFHLKPANDLLS